MLLDGPQDFLKTLLALAPSYSQTTSFLELERLRVHCGFAGDLDVFTYEVPGYTNITIPAFNVPLDVGVQLLWKSMNGETVTVDLPEIVNGAQWVEAPYLAPKDAMNQ